MKRHGMVGDVDAALAAAEAAIARGAAPSSRRWCASRASAPTRPRRRRAGQRRGDRRAPRRARPRSRAARGCRGLAAVRHRRVDARRRRCADRPALRAPRRAAAGHRRELGERSVRTRRARTAGSTGAAAPTTRRAQSRTRTRSAAWLRSTRRAPVQRARADRGRGGDRVARRCTPFSAAHLDELRSDVLVLADAGNWTVGRPGPHVLIARPRGGRHRAPRARRSGALGNGRRRDPRSGDGAGPAARVAGRRARRRSPFDGLLGRRATPRPTETGRPIAGFDDDAGRASRTRSECAPASSSSAIPRSPLHERLWFRPALTVIGIDGHPIKGSSNQIVARASARLSLRLAPGQDPDRVTRGVARAHRAARAVGPRAALPRARRRARVADRPDRSRVRRGDGARPAAPASAPSRCSWASAGRSRSSDRSPTRSAGSPRSCSGPPIPAAASTARTRACTSTTGAKLIRSEVCLLSELAAVADLSPAR